MAFSTLQDIYQNPPPSVWGGSPTAPQMSGGYAPVAAPQIASPDPAASAMGPTAPTQPLSFDDWFKNYQATANSDAGQQTFLGPNQQAHDAYNIYTQGQYPVGDPRSYAPGLLQSQYGPGYQSVLDQLNAGGGNTGDLQALLRNWSSAYTAGKPYETWQSDAATSAQGTPIIGGGKYGLDAPTIGQLALGGAGGAAYNAGVGAGSGAGAVGVTPAATTSVGGSAPTLGQVGTAASGAGAVSSALGDSQATSPTLGATQDPLGSGGDPGNAVTGSGGSGGATGAGSALSRIIDGTATTADYISVLGGAAGTGLGIAGSISQQNALKDLASKQMAMGAPYRDRLAALYADPNAFLKSAEVTTPVQQGTDALARSLSVQGNPIGSGHALQELQNYSANQLFGKLGQEKDRLAGYGGLTAYNAAAPGTALAGINAGSNVWNAVGSGIANLTNPQPSLIDLYKTMKGLA